MQKVGRVYQLSSFEAKCRKEMSFMLMFRLLPSSKEDYTSMESLIYHFKIVMGEVPVPG
jgi:hypothetical protein